MTQLLVQRNFEDRGMKMKIKFLCAVACVVVLGGCASKPEQVDVRTISDVSQHQIYIDESGNLLNPETGGVVKNEADYVGYILENIAEARRRVPGLELVVYIHGGLNTFGQTNQRVRETKDHILRSGQYPIYISWNSSLLTNYIDHLFKIRRGIRSPILGLVSSPFVLVEDAARSVARIPASLYNVLFGQNSVVISIRTKEEKAAVLALEALHKQGFSIHNSPKGTGLGFWDWVTVVNPLKLVSAPFVDGLGTGAWNSMLRRTDLVLQEDVVVSEAARRNSQIELASKTAASDFFDRFQKHFGDVKINIVGHSMGTIVANNIVAKYGDLKFENIIHMAAACRIKDLEYVVAPYLEKNVTTNYYALTLNAYRDISENAYFDVVPRGSLLMWIDQTLGNTNSFQDRTAGFWFNLVRGASTAFSNPSIRSRVHLTQFGIEDEDKGPQKHGDFGDYEFWNKDFWVGVVAP
jgi:hypothetical protein